MSEPIDIELAEALWRLRKLPVENVEDLATHALLAGHDGPALRELAWPHASWHSVGSLFEQALKEMGRPEINRKEAVTRLIRHHASKIASGEADPFDEAYELYWAVRDEFSTWDDYDSVVDLIRWADDGAYHVEDQAQFQARIIQRAQELLVSDPVELSRQNAVKGKVYPRSGEWIGEDIARLMLLEAEPSFQGAWCSFVEASRLPGHDNETFGLCTFMSEYARHVGDLMLQHQTEHLPAVFRQVERLMANGMADVKDAAATCLVEDLMNRDEVPAGCYVPLFGPETASHARAWDKFTGVQTPGLSPESENGSARPWWRFWK